MVKQLVTHFNKYCNKDVLPGDEVEETKTEVPAGQKDFSLYKDLQTKNGKKGSEIFFQFLSKIFDCQYTQLQQYFKSYIRDMINAGVFTSDDVAKGLNSFMAIYTEQVLDLPNLKEFMATTIFELIYKESVEP
jgi:hypothetical protein